MSTAIKTLKVRIKDKHTKRLNRWAFECDQVWNAANALSAEYSWVPIPGVGYMNFNTSEFDLNHALKSIRDEPRFSISPLC